MDDLSRIEELKAEGNSLHAQQKYQEAYDKYTEAIILAPNNAVLYFNRAAASIHMKGYLDASSDVTNRLFFWIPPIIRRGRVLALSSWESSIKAYQKALDTMPPSGDVKTLKKQCQEGLDSARQMLNKPLDHSQFETYTADTYKSNPIERARAMQADLRKAENFKSSAWTVIYADNEFRKGVGAMDNMPSYVNGQTKPAVRSLFPTHSQRCWEFLYNRQMLFELRTYGAWDGVGAKKVMEDAPERLRTSGWDSLRPALEVTVKIWVVTAFQNTMINNLDAAVPFYRSAFDLLTAGQTMWKDVPREDRGHIFDMTFVRDVKRLYMLSLFEAFMLGGKLNSSYKFDEILRLAHEIIAEVKANPAEPDSTYDHGVVISLWGNTIGDAYSLIANHNLETGKLPSTKPKTAHKLFTEAARYYLLAAEAYPKDDEKHITFLAMAIHAYWLRGTPLRLTYPLSKRLCEDKVLAQRIWLRLTHSTNMDIIGAIDFKELCDKAIAKGTMTLDDVVQPEWVSSLESNPGPFTVHKGTSGWKWKVYKKH